MRAIGNPSIAGVKVRFVCADRLKGIVDLNPELPHGAFELCMDEQEFAGTEISGALVEESVYSPLTLRPGNPQNGGLSG